MSLLFICITLIYLILIGSFIIGFDKIELFTVRDIKPKTKFSIIIPFRNEAENIPELLASLKDINYPKHLFEVLCIDDDSNDNSVGLISKFSEDNSDFQIRILKNKRTSNSPKKDAITSAITTSQFDWIITTDADCILPKYWLDSFDAFIQQKAVEFIVAPVTYTAINSSLKRFQLLDFLSLIGATVGGFGIKKPFLCNGANLAYSKLLFNNVNGYKGNDTIASGDDIFLLEKALQLNKSKVGYLKSKHAIVQTKPQPNWNSLIAQRKRWAAKTSSYNSLFGKLTGLVVLAMNGALICTLTLTTLGLFSLRMFLYLFIIKSGIDFLLLFKTSQFFNQERYLKAFIISSIIYPFFSIYIAFISLFTTYKWKDRTFSK
jgi:cellulose synthase/poly-beta-1,6-N-acetylglucosamine synthase-like glycosyltransferase